MEGHGRSQRGWVVAIMVIGLAVPLLLYWLLVGRGPGISVTAARQLLETNAGVLVDVDAEHGPAAPEKPTAVDWPFAAAMQAGSAGDVPVGLRGRKLLLICPGGVQAALAAAHLRATGVQDSYCVNGGWQEWISTNAWLPVAKMLHADPAADARLPAFHVSPAYKQWAAVLAFFVVKFFYTAINTAIIIMLWRQKTPDLAALRRAMICFFIGEAGCFVNEMVFFDHSLLVEYVHNAGMVLTFAFTIYALLEAIDTRLIHYSDQQRCAAASLCRGCIKHAEVGCGLRRVFLMVVPATALLALIPLISPFREMAYNTRIFGVMHSYGHPLIEQGYEIRYLPILAIVLLAVCFYVLWLKERHPVPLSKILFSAAAGALGFSFFRLVLVAVYENDQVWFDAWEEITELMYVSFFGGLLIIFARGLGMRAAGAAVQLQAAPQEAQ